MEQPDLDAPLRLVTLMWVLLSSTVLVAGVVAYVLLTNGTLGPASLEPFVVAMVAPMLLVVMAGGIVLARRMEGTLAGDAGDEARIQRYQTARIVALAMQEGPALAIIVLSVLAGVRSWVVAAVAVGVWTMFLVRPRRDELEALLRR
jgi:hypothetical protein